MLSGKQGYRQEFLVDGGEPFDRFSFPINVTAIHGLNMERGGGRLHIEER